YAQEVGGSPVPTVPPPAADLISATDAYAVATIDGCSHAANFDAQDGGLAVYDGPAKAMLSEQVNICCACGPHICDHWWCFFTTTCEVFGDGPCCCTAIIEPDGTTHCYCAVGKC